MAAFVSSDNLSTTNLTEELAINLDSSSDDIVTKHLKEDEEYELVLHIANYSDVIVGVEIWKL